MTSLSSLVIKLKLLKVVERLRSCEAACELLEKYNMSYQTETNWMDELDSKLRNLEELEEARAKEAWEKHVVSRLFVLVWMITSSDTVRYNINYIPGYKFVPEPHKCSHQR